MSEIACPPRYIRKCLSRSGKKLLMNVEIMIVVPLEHFEELRIGLLVRVKGHLPKLDRAANDSAERLNDLRLGQFVTGDLDSSTDELLRPLESQCRQRSDVVDGDHLLHLVEAQANASECAAKNCRPTPVIVLHEGYRAQDGRPQAECVDILLDLPLTLKVGNAGVAFCTADGRIDKVPHLSGFRCVSDELALAHLAFEPNVWQPVVLDTEHAVHTLQSSLERGAIFVVTLDNFRTRLRQHLGCGFVGVASERPYAPAVRQQVTRRRAALLPGCTGYQVERLY